MNNLVVGKSSKAMWDWSDPAIAELLRQYGRCRVDAEARKRGLVPWRARGEVVLLDESEAEMLRRLGIVEPL